MDVNMAVKALREVKYYCAGQKLGCRGCAFWSSREKDCKLYGLCPIAWDLDDIGDAATDTSEKEV